MIVSSTVLRSHFSIVTRNILGLARPPSSLPCIIVFLQLVMSALFPLPLCFQLLPSFPSSTSSLVPSSRLSPRSFASAHSLVLLISRIPRKAPFIRSWHYSIRQTWLSILLHHLLSHWQHGYVVGKLEELQHLPFALHKNVFLSIFSPKIFWSFTNKRVRARAEVAHESFMKTRKESIPEYFISSLSRRIWNEARNFSTTSSISPLHRRPTAIRPTFLTAICRSRGSLKHSLLKHIEQLIM